MPSLAEIPLGPKARIWPCYEGVTQSEALARLRFLKANRRVGLLVGDAGLGKSTLLQVFCEQCRREGSAAVLVKLGGLSVNEFYRQLAMQLGGRVSRDDDFVRLSRRVSDIVTANELAGKSTIALVDDLHEAGPTLVDQVTRLVQFNSQRALLTLVLATRALDRLSESLRELIDLRIDLEPWDELDSVGCLQAAMMEFEGNRQLFEHGALSEIHRLSGGVPREVARLAEFALASQSTEALVDPQSIRIAHAELTLAQA